MKKYESKIRHKVRNVGFFGSSGIEKTILIFENTSKIRQDEEKKMPVQKICTGKKCDNNVTV